MKKYQLMAPGPTPVPSQVLLAMAQPILHHRTPEYEALFIEVRAGLKRLFQTTQDVLPFASSGTGVMEAAIANTLSAGDEVLLVRAGKFADRFAEICDAWGVRHVDLTAPFGQTVTPERVAEGLLEREERGLASVIALGQTLETVRRRLVPVRARGEALHRVDRKVEIDVAARHVLRNRARCRP